MKVFNVIKKIILFLSFVLLGVCFVLAGITLEPRDAAVSTGLLMFVIPAFVGFFLFGSENKTANKIGMGLTTAAMLIELFFSLTYLENCTAAIMGLCSVVLYVIYFIVVFVGYLAMGEKTNNDPEKDPRIVKILGWKKLKEEGIISEEEFEEKRVAILGLNKKKDDTK